jgi:hypothetical protein
VADNIQELAHAVIEAHHRLQLKKATRPMDQLIDLKSQCQRVKLSCREMIGEVFGFAKRIASSFVEVCAIDEFLGQHPAAVASSSQTLQNVVKELRGISEFVAGQSASLSTIRVTICISAMPVPTVQHALPGTADYLFVRFERCLRIEVSSVQHVEDQLHELVLSLEHPNDPNQGVLRHLSWVRLREEEHAWKRLEEQWANQLYRLCNVLGEIRQVDPMSRNSGEAKSGPA